MPHPHNRRRNNPHFLARDEDRTSRVRIRFDEVESTLIDDASGTTPVLEYIHQAVMEKARRDIEARQANTPKRRPPVGVSA